MRAATERRIYGQSTGPAGISLRQAKPYDGPAGGDDLGGPRVDAAVGRELLQAVEPLAIDAAFEAERMHRERQQDQQRILDMEIQQARYDASLAERRYAACDPDNRLIAAQLEKNWEVALRRVRDLEMRQPTDPPSDIKVEPSAFISLADNLSAAWHAPMLRCAPASNCCGP